MGNTEGEPLECSICLSEETKSKLKDFVANLTFEGDSSLHFIILEGDSVLLRIDRFNTNPWENIWWPDPIQSWVTFKFHIRWCRRNKFGYPQKVGYDFVNMKECFDLMKKHVSPYGVAVIEYSKELDRIMSNPDPFADDPMDVIRDLRSTMKLEFNRNISLSNLTKQVILSRCKNLNQLPLPRKIVEYLKE